MIVDDAHVADPGSLLLTKYVAKLLPELPVTLIITRRCGEAGLDQDVARLLAELEQEATLIALPHFDLRETSMFLAVHGVREPRTDVLAAVHRVTDGHPLSLRRLVALGPPDPMDALPAGLCGAVKEAARRLAPAVRHVLEVSAVLGVSPVVTEAATLAGISVHSVIDAAAQAAQAGLVDHVGDESFTFSHDLVRETLIDSLTPATRLDLHAQAAALLEVTLPVNGSDPVPLARRAHHAVHAAARSPEDAAIAVEACTAAARAMIRCFAYEQASSLLATASQWQQRAGRSAGLLLERAQAVLLCGRLREARSLFGEATTSALECGDSVLVAQAVLGLGGVWVNEHRDPVERDRVLGLQRRALAQLPVGETELRCRLITRLAAEDVYHGGPIEAVLDALHQTRRCGDAHALAEALSLTHHALLSAEHARARLAHADELIGVAAAAGHGVLTLLGLCWRTVDLFHLGDDRAHRALADLRVRADMLGCQSVRYIVSVIDVMLLTRAGKLADALAYLGAQLLAIRWLQGRELELLDLATDMARSPTNPGGGSRLRMSCRSVMCRGIW